MKRISLLAVLICVFLLAFSGVAFANFGIHGGYSLDTDACAGCHRAHTSFSEATWTDYSPEANERSALLVSSARTISDFCNVCHGNDAPGASTNVMGGVFDSGPSADQFGQFQEPGEDLAPALYTTNSTFGEVLNGGGFLYLGGDDTREATSIHNMEGGDQTDPMWGGGLAWQPMGTNLTCTDCHDPHGSSNYRLLKDRVNNQTVGGYDTQGTPDPWVISNEEGYPLQGWLRGDAGHDQMEDYNPNYTEPEYAYMQPAGGESRSMSGWCAACHTDYHMQKDEGWVIAGEWGQYEDWAGTGYQTSAAHEDGLVASAANYPYNDTVSVDYEAGVGVVGRHRHPINITLGATTPEQHALGDNPLALPTRLDDAIPLEAVPGTYDRGDWGYDSYIGCLTCHVAHGTEATMEGWANSEYYYTDSFEAWDEGVVGDCGRASMTTTDMWMVQLRDPEDECKQGVNPQFSSALLRVNDRGVCQRCHYK